MNNIRITKEFSFEMAHALTNYDGKCANIHGHSYKMEVTILGKPLRDEDSPKLGMVMDFSDLKKIVKEAVIDEFDHALVLRSKHPLLEELKQNNHVVEVNYQPTSENLLLDFVQRIQEKIKVPLILHSIVLRETVSSYASWYASDNL